MKVKIEGCITGGISTPIIDIIIKDVDGNIIGGATLNLSNGIDVADAEIKISRD